MEISEGCLAGFQIGDVNCFHFQNCHPAYASQRATGIFNAEVLSPPCGKFEKLRLRVKIECRRRQSPAARDWSRMTVNVGVRSRSEVMGQVNRPQGANWSNCRFICISDILYFVTSRTSMTLCPFESDTRRDSYQQVPNAVGIKYSKVMGLLPSPDLF